MQYKWTALTVTTVGTLISGLDLRILVVGLPTVASQLHATPEEVIWISQSFLLASTVSLLLFGRIADIFGRVKLFNIGFAVFTIGSTLSALSASTSELIAFRIVQGIGAALLSSNGAAIVTDASPPNELGTMLGINQTAFRIGAVAGLTLSGLVLSVFDWRGLFYVNIPIGLFGTVWSYLRLREIALRDTSRNVDWLGFGVFSCGLLLILLSITFLSYGLSDLLIGASVLATGVVLLAVFVAVESKVSGPLLDLRLFRIKLFAGGNFSQLLNSMSWSGVLLLVAFFLQIGLGYTALEAGLGIVPIEVTYVVSSLISGKLSDRYGSGALCTIGLGVMTASYLWLATFDSHASYPQVAAVLGVIGLGNGMFTSPNLRAIMASVPPDRRGIASSFRQTMFNVGSTTSFGLVILFITFGIPYSSLSILLQNYKTSLMSAERLEFVAGFRIAALLLAVLDGLAIFPSAMRGHREEISSTIDGYNGK
jgi:EmrB/QacA subfamily drug resistance transporter